MAEPPECNICGQPAAFYDPQRAEWLCHHNALYVVTSEADATEAMEQEDDERDLQRWESERP